MDKSMRWRSLPRWIPTFGLSATGALFAGLAVAGCGDYVGPGAVPDWNGSSAAVGFMTPGGDRAEANGIAHAAIDESAQNVGIVGMWKFAFVSDGTAYPAPIPSGAVIDFGTSQWHGDGTEILVSGGRPPSTGDVCMGVWKKVGPHDFKLKHIGLSWLSSDTPAPLGPVSPAVFVGPATIREDVTLSQSGASFGGTFTIDQYAADGTTLLEHIGGSVSATRMVVD